MAYIPTVARSSILGHVLRSHRKEAKSAIGQENIAKILGVSISNISRMESGEAPISAIQLLSWCAALHVSPNKVFEEMQEIEDSMTRIGSIVIVNTPEDCEIPSVGNSFRAIIGAVSRSSQGKDRP